MSRPRRLPEPDATRRYGAGRVFKVAGLIMAASRVLKSEGYLFSKACGARPTPSLCVTVIVNGLAELERGPETFPLLYLDLAERPEKINTRASHGWPAIVNLTNKTNNANLPPRSFTNQLIVRSVSRPGETYHELKKLEAMETLAHSFHCSLCDGYWDRGRHC